MAKNAVVETDFTVYATKTPTTMQARFADWLLEETEYDPSKAKSKEEAFRMGVALGAYLRPTYQASDANQSARKETREAAPEKAVKTPRAAKAAKVAAEAPAAPVATPKPTKAAKTAKGGPKRAAARPASAEASDSPF